MLKSEEDLVYESGVWETDVILAERVAETNGMRFKLLYRNKFETLGSCYIEV